MGSDLNNKPKALLIMPKFYSYADALLKELKTRGYEIRLFYEEPPAFFFLLIRRISRILHTNFLYSIFCRSLYKKIIDTGDKFDIFILIRGNIIQSKFITQIANKCLTTNSRKVYYTWDSFRYLEHKGCLAKSFDEKYSFDSENVKTNPDWNLLPLFYTDKYNIKKIQHVPDLKYDICCIASYNDERFLFIKRFVEHNPKLKIKIILYIDKKIYETKVKTNSNLRNIDPTWLIFNYLSSEKVVEINLSSKAILDYTDSLQCGLSMRTIESVGLKRKLITNNKSILEYDIYSPENVLVVDSEIQVPEEWIRTDYAINDKIWEKYSLGHWIDTILGIKTKTNEMKI